MGTVKLRVNLVTEEHHLIPFGTEIDESKVPPRLRKRRYILRPGERDIDEINFKAQASVAENEIDMDEVAMEEESPQTEEEVVRHHVANRRGMRRG